jgi:hypothetical protein
VWECGLDSSGSVQASVLGSCEHTNEPSGSVKVGKHFDHLTDCQLLQKVSSKSLWAWYANEIVDFLGIFHRPVPSDISFCFNVKSSRKYRYECKRRVRFLDCKQRRVKWITDDVLSTHTNIIVFNLKMKVSFGRARKEKYLFLWRSNLHHFTFQNSSVFIWQKECDDVIAGFIWYITTFQQFLLSLSPVKSTCVLRYLFLCWNVVLLVICCYSSHWELKYPWHSFN